MPELNDIRLDCSTIHKRCDFYSQAREASQVELRNYEVMRLNNGVYQWCLSTLLIAETQHLIPDNQGGGVYFSSSVQVTASWFQGRTPRQRSMAEVMEEEQSEKGDPSRTLPNNLDLLTRPSPPTNITLSYGTPITQSPSTRPTL